MKKSMFVMFVAAGLGLAGCQSTTDEGGEISSASSKAAPSTFDIGKKKLFVTMKYNYQRQDHYSHTNKGNVTESQSGTFSTASLIRQNGDNLLIADPDNQAGTVFVNDKSVKTSGSISGKGRRECVKLQIEEGYQRNICSSYTYRNGILQINEEDKDPGLQRTTKTTYKIAYDGDSCKFISSTSTTVANQAYCDMPCLTQYGGSTQWRYTSKSTATSGSCSIR